MRKHHHLASWTNPVTPSLSETVSQVLDNRVCWVGRGPANNVKDSLVPASPLTKDLLLLMVLYHCTFNIFGIKKKINYLKMLHQDLGWSFFTIS